MSSLRKFKYAFLMILFVFFIFKDPEPVFSWIHIPFAAKFWIIKSFLFIYLRCDGKT